MSDTRLFPDFSGTWEVNLARSVLRGPAPKRMLVEIEHREPHLIQQVVVTSADGSEQRLTCIFAIGAETENSVGGATLRTRAWWQQRELVLDSRMTTPAREFHFKDHWSLSEDGKTLTMAHRDDELEGQVSVLEKLPGTTPARA
jgi:hypothetical protein